MVVFSSGVVVVSFFCELFVFVRLFFFLPPPKPTRATHLRPEVLELQRRARLEPVVAQLAAVLERLAALLALLGRQREALARRVKRRLGGRKLGLELVDGGLGGCCC
jgi:hypothetical protein